MMIGVFCPGDRKFSSGDRSHFCVWQESFLVLIGIICSGGRSHFFF